MKRRYLHQLNNAKDELEFINILKNQTETQIDTFFKKLSSCEVSAGTKLYRIRKNIGDNEDNPWGIPQIKKSYGRFDKNNDILYLAQDPRFLPQECECKKGDTYYLGTYKVTKNFKFGMIVYPDMEFDRISLQLNGICHALKYNNLSMKERNSIVNRKDFLKYPILYSLCVGQELSDKLYDYTNWIGDHILKFYNNGFAYGSSYDLCDFALGDVNFTTGDYKNMALTSAGCENIKFVGYQKCVCDREHDFCECIKTSINVGETL